MLFQVEPFRQTALHCPGFSSGQMRHLCRTCSHDVWRIGSRTSATATVGLIDGTNKSHSNSKGWFGLQMFVHSVLLSAFQMVLLSWWCSLVVTSWGLDNKAYYYDGSSWITGQASCKLHCVSPAPEGNCCPKSQTCQEMSRALASTLVWHRLDWDARTVPSYCPPHDQEGRQQMSETRTALKAKTGTIPSWFQVQPYTWGMDNSERTSGLSQEQDKREASVSTHRNCAWRKQPALGSRRAHHIMWSSTSAQFSEWCWAIAKLRGGNNKLCIMCIMMCW